MWCELVLILCFTNIHGFTLRNDNSRPKHNRIYLAVSQQINDGSILQRFSFLPSQESRAFHFDRSQSDENSLPEEVKMSIDELKRNYTVLQQKFELMSSEIDGMKQAQLDDQTLRSKVKVSSDNNKTPEIERTLNELQSKIKSFEERVSENISSIQRNLRQEEQSHLSLKDVHRMLEDLQKADNETVALSATASSGTISPGSILKFPNVKRHHGVNDPAVNNFKSSGKFVCNKSGLYIITANILSEKEGSWFKIVLNNTELTRTYIAYHRGKAEGWHSSTGVTYAMLTHGDTISVVAGSSLKISGHNTTLMIVKIK